MVGKHSIITEVWSSEKLGRINGPAGLIWTKEALIICYGNFHFKLKQDCVNEYMSRLLKHASTWCYEQMDSI